jgi:N-acylneuraminate cytidylyltransferase
MKSVALIPARAGSQRVKHKNILPVQNHPLIAYTISAAIDSNIFDSVICVTDSKEYAEIAQHYGAEVPILRPSDTAESNSPDIHWVNWILEHLARNDRSFDIFSILRPTNPLRTVETITRAWNLFIDAGESVDSLRAVELCNQHPGKMWQIKDNFLKPLMSDCTEDGTPFHSNQYNALPKIYVQNASLEIAWYNVLAESNSISGNNILPLISQGLEGFDINYPEDLERLENLLRTGQASLPSVRVDSYKN